MSIWTIDSALALIREIEPELKEKAHYFLGLCGGVLRKGYSDKDLDLILIPMNGDEPPNIMVAFEVLECRLGSLKPCSWTPMSKQEYQPLTFWQQKERRIDIIQFGSL